MNITENVVRIISIDELGYDSRIYHTKNLLPFYYLTKRGFNDLCDDLELTPTVVGDVYIHQRRYIDIEQAKNPEEEEKKKAEKGIIGVATREYTYEYEKEHPDCEKHKKYDLYEQSNNFRKCIGYANIGNGKFVRLVTKKCYPFLILILLLLLIPLMMKNCPKFDPITINNGLGITEKSDYPTNSELCYYTPFSETTVLTKEHPEITLTNVSTNENEYYISFSIYINGEAMKNEKGEVFTTGAIPPNRQVNINLWNELDEGIYELKAIATDYDFKKINDLMKNEGKYSESDKAKLLAEATMPVKHTLSTTLIIKK